MRFLRRAFAYLLNYLGFDLKRAVRKRYHIGEDFFSQDLGSHRVPLYRYAVEAAFSVDGMTSARVCEELFLRALTQPIDGNVVEIGVWKGRSAICLALGVLSSQNGRLICIDHFEGNRGKERSYFKSGETVSDIKSSFLSTARQFGFDKQLVLIDESSIGASEKIQDDSVRLLFIDGDHSLFGVTGDVLAYWDKLKVGGSILFDDFNVNSFPGVVEAVSVLLSHGCITKSVLIERLFVATKTADGDSEKCLWALRELHENARDLDAV